jgi:DNA excision repair protein ERCC-4
MTLPSPNTLNLPSVQPGAGTQPVIIVDTREQEPLSFPLLQSRPGTLIAGDYSVAGLEELFAVERKSIADLVSCCMGDNRDRFERSLCRLRGYRFKRFLIVGSRGEIEIQHYHSRISPKSVLGSLNAWEARYDVPVIFCPTPEESGRLIERWAYWFAREIVLTTNRLIGRA